MSEATTKPAPKAPATAGNNDPRGNRNDRGGRGQGRDRNDRGRGKGRGRGRDRGGREKQEFEQTLLDVARVTRVVKGGRRFSFRATLAIGDKKGRVGVGIGKGPDVSAAINKAYARAKRDMITVPIVNGTIPHQITVKNGASKLFLKPAKPGTGIIAGSAPRSVLELSGIKNVFGKIYGSGNKVNNARAVIKGLSMQRTPEQVAKDRGIKIADLEAGARLEKAAAKKAAKKAANAGKSKATKPKKPVVKTKKATKKSAK